MSAATTKRQRAALVSPEALEWLDRLCTINGHKIEDLSPEVIVTICKVGRFDRIGIANARRIVAEAQDRANAKAKAEATHSAKGG
jgi:maleate cis-trans isomerase